MNFIIELQMYSCSLSVKFTEDGNEMPVLEIIRELSSSSELPKLVYGGIICIGKNTGLVSIPHELKCCINSSLEKGALFDINIV